MKDIHLTFLALIARSLLRLKGVWPDTPRE
jgi:hypothetical protein